MLFGFSCVARPCSQLVKQMLLVSKGYLGDTWEPRTACRRLRGCVLSRETHWLFRMWKESGWSRKSRKEELVLHLCPKLMIWLSVENKSVTRAT